MATITSDVHFDPWDDAIMADPYPVFRRMRDEAPLYYNSEHDFFAVSRYGDVERAIVDRANLISGKGGLIELIRMGMEIPRGLIVFEDPPVHTIHRALLSRVFTPRAMAAIEPEVREFTARVLDGLVGRDRFDAIAEIGSRIPIRVIGMLLGIPENDQDVLRGQLAESMEHPDRDDLLSANDESDDMFGAYLDWRVEHPSDDVMTMLLNAEFEDEKGMTRRLERPELLMLVNVLAGAGIDTTNRLIGWTVKILSDHPDQRAMVAAEPSLLANTIEEILRYEGPTYYFARAVVNDIEFQGETVPAGSILAVLPASANRDERRFEDPDTFDVRRDIGHILTFGFGAHYCLGASLARLEGQVVLDEMLRRFPKWQVDEDKSSLFPGAFFRGWETLPVIVG